MLMNESTKPNIAIGQERAEGGMRGEEKEKKKRSYLLSSPLFTTDQVENYLYGDIHYGYMGLTL